MCVFAIDSVIVGVDDKNQLWVGKYKGSAGKGKMFLDRGGHVDPIITVQRASSFVNASYLFDDPKYTVPHSVFTKVMFLNKYSTKHWTDYTSGNHIFVKDKYSDKEWKEAIIASIDHTGIWCTDEKFYRWYTPYSKKECSTPTVYRTLKKDELVTGIDAFDKIWIGYYESSLTDGTYMIRTETNKLIRVLKYQKLNNSIDILNDTKYTKTKETMLILLKLSNYNIIKEDKNLSHTFTFVINESNQEAFSLYHSAGKQHITVNEKDGYYLWNIHYKGVYSIVKTDKIDILIDYKTMSTSKRHWRRARLLHLNYHSQNFAFIETLDALPSIRQCISVKLRLIKFPTD